MTLPTTILAILGIAAIAGGLAAYFRKSAGKETINLLETNIQAYKDSEKLKDARIAYLEGQLLVKEETIKRLLDAPKSTRKKR